MAMNFPDSPTTGQTFSVSGGPTYSYDGSKWRVLTPGNQFARTTVTATAGQTSFSVVYTVGAVDVFKNGLKLLSGIDFTATNGTTVVLTNGATAGDKIEIVSYSQITYTAVSLTSNVTGTLPVANGGTGLTSLTAGYIPYGNGTGAFGNSANLTYNGSQLSVTTSGNGNAFVTTNGSTSAAIFTGGASITFGDAAGNNQALIVPGSNYYTIYTSGSEKMRITSAGDVGIGTSSPSYRLQVGDGSADTRALFNSNNAFSIGVKNGSNAIGGWIGSNGGNVLTFAGNDGTIKATLDASGNLGLGVTPSAWPGQSANYDVLQAGLCSFANIADVAAEISYNQYIDSAGTRRYISTNTALRYRVGNTEHAWFTAASGTAGSTISFTQAMTLDASGQLIIGNTSGSAPLHVYNTANSGWGAIVEKSAGSGTPHGLMAVVAQNSGSNYIFAAAQGSYASPNYKFVVTGAGQVGIGLSNPSYKLDIYDNVASPLIINAVNANTGGSSTAGYYMSHGAGTVGRMYVDNGSFIFGSFSNHALRIFTNSSESARIDASGNLMVNTTSAIGASKFSVSADTTNQNPMALANTRTTAATDYSLLLYRAGSIVGSIQTSLTATTYVTSSDASLKENIEDADSALASILALPIRKFDWKCDSSHTDYGLIAQEADNCAPEIVVKNELWSVEYGRITPRLIKAFQELAAKVSALEARI